MNPAFTGLTGYALDDIRGADPTVLAAGQTADERYRGMWDSVMHTGYWQGEVIDRRKDGTLYPKDETLSSAAEALPEKADVLLFLGETGWAELPWAAWREPLPMHTESAAWAAAARRAYRAALASMGWHDEAPQLPPYDLLLRLDRLFFIPRRVERLAGVSVNALGYAGSLFAASPEKLRALAALDLVAGLCTLGWPRAELASGKR